MLIVGGILEWKRICTRFCIVCFYICIYIVVGDPIMKRMGIWIQLTSFTPPHLVPFPSQDLDF